MSVGGVKLFHPVRIYIGYARLSAYLPYPLIATIP